MAIFITYDRLTSGNTKEINREETFDYSDRYPDKLDLNPHSEFHAKLLAELSRMIGQSRDAISQRFDSWNQVDKMLTGYIDLSKDEEKLKAKDPRNPISIVIPITYATMETLRTFYAAAFLSNPILKYDPQSEEDVVGAALMERLIQSHSHRFQLTLPLMSLWRDGLAYDFGVAHPIWDIKKGKRRVRRSSYEFQDEFVSSVFSPLEQVVENSIEDTILYEGNRLITLDPYQCLPDPNVPIDRIQDGNMFGFTIRMNRMNALELELDNEAIFNARYLKSFDTRSYLMEESPDARDKYDVSNDSTNTDVVDLTYLYAKIIPSELGIKGYGEFPQQWMFIIAGDRLIMSAEPLNLFHGQFPIIPCAPNYDGHSISSSSKLEMMVGMQDTINFLYNSHFANVRKAVNDMFIVDPQMVNMNDITNPQEGLLIRMRQRFWGKRAVRDAMHQFPVKDVTQSHISLDVPNVLSLIERTTGATENLQGIRRTTSERVSATEAGGINQNALGRMEASARIISTMTMSPLGYFFASHAQQFMEKGEYVKITGRYEEDLREIFPEQRSVYVNPDDINIDYDLVEHDGSIPGSGDPNILLQMFQTAASNERLSAETDLMGMMKFIAKVSGAKNFQDFAQASNRPPVVTPDAQVQEQLQAGNLIPLSEAT